MFSYIMNYGMNLILSGKNLIQSKIRMKIAIISTLLCCSLISGLQAQNHLERPRLLVLTDIGGDPDDKQSLRRLMLYSNEFRIEGLIATATWGFIGERMPPGQYKICEELIHEIIDDYDSVYHNLLLHDKNYPLPSDLRKVVRGGQKDRGVDNLKQGLSTPGSQHIITTVDQSDEPLCVAVWGGAHDLAQALLDVKSTRTKQEVDRFISKLRVYAINDQDRKFHPKNQGTGEWITANFPDLFYIESGPLHFYFTGAYRGMYQNDESDSTLIVKEGIELLNNSAWILKNITPYGALGKRYPADVNQNPKTPRNTKGIKEGDTPSWFYFMPTGLNDYERPEWGGWGGRYEHASHGQYYDAQDDHWSGTFDGRLRRKWTVARWREAYQNDFAARIRWCVLPYNEANHNPVAVIDGDRSKNILVKHARPGQVVTVDASGSFDPDKDKVTFKWWIYHEASSSVAIVKNSTENKAEIIVQDTAPRGDVHLILEVKDNGDPALIGYRRVIIRVKN